MEELNSLEMTFLALLDFNLSIDPILFDEYRYEVELQIIRSLETEKATDELPFGPESSSDREEVSNEVSSCFLSGIFFSLISSRLLMLARTHDTFQKEFAAQEVLLK